MTDQLATTPPAPPQLLLTPRQAAQALGIGRSHLYELIAKGEIESVRIGASRRIPLDALERFVLGLRGGVELLSRPDG